MMEMGIFSPLMSPDPLNKSESLIFYEDRRDTVLKMVAFWHGLRNDRLAKAQTHFQVPGQNRTVVTSSRLRLIDNRASTLS